MQSRMNNIAAVLPLAGTLICARTTGSALASPPGDSSAVDHATVPSIAVGPVWPRRSS